MRILDEQGQEIRQEDIDLTLGYLESEQIFKEHHDAIQEVQEQGHYYPETFYFMDGSYYKVNMQDESDPCVQANDDGVSFNYIAPEGEEEREFKGCDVKYIIDVEYQEGKEEWDEYEDIQRYKLYTEEELQQRKEEQERLEKEEQFLQTGPDRLTTVETGVNGLVVSVDDITMLMADMIGVG